MKLIDGRKTAELIKEEIKKEIAGMIDKNDKSPHLAAVLVGDDPASQTYVSGKEKACKKVGMMSSVYKHPANISEKELLEVVDFLNGDPEIDGFIVQLPLPDHINEQKVIEAIDPRKDVDGFHPVNLGRMITGMPAYIPATPLGIMTLLERYEIETEGKNCVVIGRSNIVGTPVGILMSRKSDPGNATVTLCHSKTENLKDIAAQADIIIAAIGKAGSVTADMVKKDAVVIDVGIHRIKSNQTKTGYKLVGDVDFDRVSKKCSYITPVPGGVGPMTIISLLTNTLKASKKEIYG
ncbi:MAG: bifunctional methylenetetrahydrofolate dehydrogenase/methenyltetrahydrofolate cyclohydrolase FolD [Bacteroidales bacterium]|nr:bifunctional methylenetetrahydrofolate dehydrogenase/methenyltetrahydrofolate cyclohydrolase FolD [Bacteroidales bacterium]MCF8350767.1 bifunctional methylenetetrahydrofolate dehydrogenase/methenyltetrahydrofolate cyclohydrolase FolD [Bacteroidales bacterium]MCF8376866.1 bifunctional methylenetetrahydrofolate dehydrogenase/methenyltetrahydrofolate cyclohydrolase FolD [Bacteroidales bacterium]MCF8401881.1 bifunctional methylenetetrahydrofolate dehydrogenase/methenyltetrahydrofolate cyclohydrol